MRVCEGSLLAGLGETGGDYRERRVSCNVLKRKGFTGHSCMPTGPWHQDFQTRKAKTLQGDTKETFSAVGTSALWSRLPREVVLSPFLEIFKNRLSKALCNLF